MAPAEAGDRSVTAHSTTRDQQIRALAETGHSNTHIARALGISPSGVTSARRRLQLPAATRRTPTVEEQFAANTRSEGGHLLWTGAYQRGTLPILNHQPATRIAWRITHGTDPVGTVTVACGQHGCIQPDHLQDAATRRRHRTALRYIAGGKALPDTCGNGHNQGAHGRLTPDGYRRCGECMRLDKQRSRTRTKKEAAA
jgi:hypothetical protein